jgi:hypothetical protein
MTPRYMRVCGPHWISGAPFCRSLHHYRWARPAVGAGTSEEVYMDISTPPVTCYVQGPAPARPPTTNVSTLVQRLGRTLSAALRVARTLQCASPIGLRLSGTPRRAGRSQAVLRAISSEGGVTRRRLLVVRSERLLSVRGDDCLPHPRRASGRRADAPRRVPQQDPLSGRAEAHRLDRWREAKCRRLHEGCARVACTAAASSAIPARIAGSETWP